MELACPNCETQFFVADNAVGPKGRKVRCSVCQHEWQATATAAAPGTGAPAAKPAAAPAKPAAAARAGASDEFHFPAGSAAESEPSPAEEKKPDPPAEPKQAAPPAKEAEAEKTASSIYSSPLESSIGSARESQSGGKRIAIGVILLVFVAASYLLRDQIVKAYPDAAKLYELAGISVSAPASTGQPANQ